MKRVLQDSMVVDAPSLWLSMSAPFLQHSAPDSRYPECEMHRRLLKCTRSCLLSLSVARNVGFARQYTLQHLWRVGRGTTEPLRRFRGAAARGADARLVKKYLGRRAVQLVAFPKLQAEFGSEDETEHNEIWHKVSSVIPAVRSSTAPFSPRARALLRQPICPDHASASAHRRRPPTRRSPLDAPPARRHDPPPPPPPPLVGGACRFPGGEGDVPP